MHKDQPCVIKTSSEVIQSRVYQLLVDNYIFEQTGRQTDGWTDRPTDRQGKQADRQTDRQTVGWTDGQTDGRTDRQTCKGDSLEAEVPLCNSVAFENLQENLHYCWFPLGEKL